MREELFDLVMVPLLTFIFALLQKGRPERRYRMWLAGWALVLVSMGIWQWEVVDGHIYHLAEALRLLALVWSGVCFLLSFGEDNTSNRQLGRYALLIGVPSSLEIALIEFGFGYRWLIAPLTVGGEFAAIWVLRHAFSVRSRLRTVSISTVCIAGGGVMLYLLFSGHADVLYAMILAQIYLAAALLFLALPIHGRAGQWIVAQGFVFWATEHPLHWVLSISPGWEKGYATLSTLWHLPKYLVALGMILRVMEEDQAHVRTLTEEYRLLYEGNPHPLFVFSPEDGRILSANDATAHAYGYDYNELLRMRVGEFYQVEEAAERSAVLRSVRRLDKQPAVHQRKNGTLFDVEMTMYPVIFHGRWARFVLAVDVTDTMQRNRELIRQAHYDALTALPNRILLEERLEHWRAHARRENKPAAIMTLDLDHFKKVNDTYGHLVGDECLREVSHRLQSRVRQSDTLARTGGEEFTLIVSQTSSREGAMKLATSLLRLFDTPLRVEGHLIPMTISIGVAMYPDDGEEIEVLRRLSDDALYEAKRSGRNRVMFVDEMVSISQLQS